MKALRWKIQIFLQLTDFILLLRFIILLVIPNIFIFLFNRKHLIFLQKSKLLRISPFFRSLDRLNIEVELIICKFSDSWNIEWLEWTFELSFLDTAILFEKYLLIIVIFTEIKRNIGKFFIFLFIPTEFVKLFFEIYISLVLIYKLNNSAACSI